MKSPNTRPKLKPLEVSPFVRRSILKVATLSEQRKLEEAVALAKELYSQFPNRGDVNDCLSLALIDIGKPAEAFKFALAAVRLEPANTTFGVNLARFYLDRREPENALPLLLSITKRRDSPLEADWALAKFYFDIGDADKAGPLFWACLKKAQGGVKVDIEIEYLDALRASGKIDEADALIESLMEQASAAKPLLLSMKAALRPYKIDSEMGLRLLQMIEHDSRSDRELSGALLQIGRMYENSKRFDEAFNFYTRAKSPLRMEGIAEDLQSIVDDLVNVFSQETIERLCKLGNPSTRLVFVVGMPRSGTTMTEQIIAAHPEAGGVGELTRITNLVKSLCPPKKADMFVQWFPKVQPSTRMEVSDRYLKLIELLAPGKQKVVDKMPHNFLHVGFIACLFPHAKFVHVHRNPLDNFISAYQNPMNEFHSYSYDQVEYGRYYLQYVRLMNHWKRVIPDRILDWPYDSVVAEPRTFVEGLLKFLALPWSEECMKFHENKSVVKTLSMFQVRKPISTASVERWRNYQAHLGPIREVLGI